MCSNPHLNKLIFCIILFSLHVILLFFFYKCLLHIIVVFCSALLILKHTQTRSMIFLHQNVKSNSFLSCFYILVNIYLVF